MKKISLILAAACTVFGMGSCSEDKDPVLQTPTEFVLNAPAMQDQYIELENTPVIELVCSQPDYGYSAVAQYSAQMSLTPDFKEGEVKDLAPKSPTIARMNIPAADVATGILELKGIDSEEAFQEAYPNGMTPEKVYFRAVCELAGVANTKIYSNVVSYNQLQGYFAVAVPGYIYLVGKPEGWSGPTESNAAHYAEWRLFEPENAIGSKIYSGTFEIGAGEDAVFRFYTALTGWDEDSYGTQVDDSPVEFPEFDGSEATTKSMVKGKGSYSFPNWPGGKMTITVNMSDPENMEVTFTPGEGGAIVVPRYIYMMGSAQGWGAPSLDNEAAYANWRLVDKSESGIYTGTFDIAAGTWQFRFALELNDDGWDNATQIGAAANDGDNKTITLNSDNEYSGGYVSGKGNWVLEDFAGGKAEVTVNTNDNTIKVVAN